MVDFTNSMNVKYYLQSGTGGAYTSLNKLVIYFFSFKTDQLLKVSYRKV